MSLIQNEMILWIINQAVKKYCYVISREKKNVLGHFWCFEEVLNINENSLHQVFLEI